MISEKTRKKILQNFMDMVADRGWSHVDLMELSEKSGIKISTMRGAYSSKFQLLEDFAAMIDQTVLDATESDIDEQTGPKDRIFDIIMARFDALSPYRDGLKRLSCSAITDPKFGLLMNRILTRSMRWMLSGARIEVRGIKGAVKAQGLGLVVKRVSRVWFRDEDAGLSQTMAALDRELNRGEMVLCQLSRVEQTICNFGRAVLSCRDRGDEPEGNGPAVEKA